MEKTPLGVVAVVAAVMGGAAGTFSAAYYLHPSKEERLAELQKQVEMARQQAAAVEKAKYDAERAQITAESARKAEQEARARGEREAQKRVAEELLRREAEAKKMAEAARARAAETARIGSAAPSATVGSEMLFEQAAALEREGRGAEAVRTYIRAARSGSGKAAKRLGEIYDKGIAGVSRDYAESLKWYNAARVLGEDVPNIRPATRTVDPVEAAERTRVSDTLFRQAQALERDGKGAEAVDLYIASLRYGKSAAAGRLAEIYRSGITGVYPDAEKAERWERQATRTPPAPRY